MIILVITLAFLVIMFLVATIGAIQDTHEQNKEYNEEIHKEVKNNDV